MMQDCSHHDEWLSPVDARGLLIEFYKHMFWNWNEHTEVRSEIFSKAVETSPEVINDKSWKICQGETPRG